MPQIPYKSDFQPSSGTLRKWLSTRKPALNVGGVIMPGFFSDTSVSADTGWFYVALIGELVGFLTTLYGGMRSGGVFLLFAGLAILMFIFCDFFFAVRLHRNKAKECELRSHRLLLDEARKNELLNIELQLKKGKFEDFIYQTCIILIAVIKVVGILFLGVFNNSILYVPFAIMYLIVAYVHLRHTGYYFAYRGTENAIDKEHKMFANGHFVAQSPRERVTLDSDLVDVPIRHSPHEIVEESNVTHTYVIKVKGVLTDEDIIALIGGQKPAHKIELFKACRRLQIEQYLVG